MLDLYVGCCGDDRLCVIGLHLGRCRIGLGTTHRWIHHEYKGDGMLAGAGQGEGGGGGIVWRDLAASTHGFFQDQDLFRIAPRAHFCFVASRSRLCRRCGSGNANLYIRVAPREQIGFWQSQGAVSAATRATLGGPGGGRHQRRLGHKSPGRAAGGHLAKPPGIRLYCYQACCQCRLVRAHVCSGIVL